jgi:NAD(P)-dependent dehydrogenase (short-subunit alcohol dehydrogenase family)
VFAPFDLKGKSCLITGGSRGIGFAMAKALAASGADLMLWANQRASLTQAAEALQVYGTRVHTRLVDVAVENQIVREMQELRAEFPRLDAVIACAGIGQKETAFVELETSIFDKVQAVNLHGTMWTMREACKLMIQQAKEGQGGGSLIGVASLAGRFGAPTMEGYAASKLAIEGLIRSLAVSMARYGVRANVVVPGWIATDMSRHYRDRPAINEHIIRRIPVRRWGTADDLGGIAVYLVSDASAYHTGDSLVIDGGYSVF